MRRLKTAGVAMALVALLWAVPVAAQPVDSPPTSWAAFAGRLADWAAGVWRVVGGSETEPPPAVPVDSDSPDSMVLDGGGETSSGTTEPEGEKFPGLDPVG